jgi:hypothetical protein
VGVAAGFWAVVDDRDGPLQVYVLAPPAGLAVSVIEVPLQAGLVLVGAAVGMLLTVTIVV